MKLTIPIIPSINFTNCTGTFFKFLAKFGFQKTNLKDQKQTQVKYFFTQNFNMLKTMIYKSNVSI